MNLPVRGQQAKSESFFHVRLCGLPPGGPDVRWSGLGVGFPLQIIQSRKIQLLCCVLVNPDLVKLTTKISYHTIAINFSPNCIFKVLLVSL